MAYITKNANILLLFLIVLCAIFLVGLALFSASQINSMNTKYQDKVSKIKEVEEDLQSKIKLLDSVKNELKLKAERETSFTAKYTEVRSEKETLEQERDRLSREKADALKNLASTQNDLVEARNRLAFDEAQIGQLNAKVSQLDSDVRAALSLAKERLAQISNLQSQLNTCRAAQTPSS